MVSWFYARRTYVSACRQILWTTDGMRGTAIIERRWTTNRETVEARLMDEEKSCLGCCTTENLQNPHKEMIRRRYRTTAERREEIFEFYVSSYLSSTTRS